MKSFVCHSRLSSEHTSPRSIAAAPYLFAILLTLVPLAVAAQTRPRDSDTAKAERVGLDLKDPESAAVIKQPPLETDPATHEKLRHSVLLSMKSLPAGPSAVGFAAFAGAASRRFLRPPDQIIQASKFSAPKMPQLKGFSLSVRPKVSLTNQNHGRRPQFPDVQGFYPRDFQGNLANYKFGILSNGVGRMFAMRFVFEKK